MRYFIIAGDPSGDLHGSNFIRELLKLDTSAEIDYVGGKNIENVLHKKPLDTIRSYSIYGLYRCS